MVNCGTGVRASISKTTLFIYLAFRNDVLFIYYPLIFYTHLLLVVRKYSSHFIKYQENKQPRKISGRKIYAYTGSEKEGPFIRIKKNLASHILFAEKRGLIIYLEALKKGAIGHAHSYYARNHMEHRAETLQKYSTNGVLHLL